MTATTERPLISAPEEPALLEAPKRPRPRYLPGDPEDRERLERMIRVDHAGEYGAKRIYEGQLAVLKRTPAAKIIRHMKDQEQEHLDAFERLIVERRVRPTVLHPVWHVAGFALGAATALLGQRAGWSPSAPTWPPTAPCATPTAAPSTTWYWPPSPGHCGRGSWPGESR